MKVFFLMEKKSLISFLFFSLMVLVLSLKLETSEQFLKLSEL